MGLTERMRGGLRSRGQCAESPHRYSGHVTASRRARSMLLLRALRPGFVLCECSQQTHMHLQHTCWPTLQCQCPSKSQSLPQWHPPKGPPEPRNGYIDLSPAVHLSRSVPTQDHKRAPSWLTIRCTTRDMNTSEDFKMPLIIQCR